MSGFENEEELQRKIERQEDLKGEDAFAYRSVFNALQREPTFHLSHDFADKVITRLETSKETQKEYVWIAVGVFVLLIATVGTFYLFGIEVSLPSITLRFDLSAYPFIQRYIWLFVFAIPFIAALHWVDKRFIRSPRYNI